MLRKIISILAIGVFVFLTTLCLDAQTYVVKKWVIGSGGVIGAQSDPYHTMSGVLGQLVIDRINYSTIDSVQQGFWYYYPPQDQGVVEPTSDVDKLLSNYPNPFYSSTTIRYELPGTSLVRLKIYDVMGNVVKVLVDGAIQEQGKQEILWDGKNENGVNLGSGSYLYELNIQPAQVVGAPGFDNLSIRNILIIVR
jgi:hypothetical protein